MTKARPPSKKSVKSAADHAERATAVKLGRPSSLTKEIANAICLRMSEGESLRSICRDELMPGKSTVFQWLQDDANKTFADQYAKARQALSDHWAEEIVEIADDGSNDYMKREREDGFVTEVLNSEHINRSRLRVDTRKWLMARMAPKKYGDKVALVGGGEGDEPMKLSVAVEYIKAGT